MSEPILRGRSFFAVPETLKHPMAALAHSMESLVSLKASIPPDEEYIPNHSGGVGATVHRNDNGDAGKVMRMIEETHAELLRLSQNIPTEHTTEAKR